MVTADRDERSPQGFRSGGPAAAGGAGTRVDPVLIHTG